MYGDSSLFPRNLRHCYNLSKGYVDDLLGLTKHEPKRYTVTADTVVSDDAVLAVMDTFFKVSNDTPNIDGWTLTTYATDGTKNEFVLDVGVNAFEMNGLVMAEVLVVAYQAGAEIDGVVIPEAGLYMLRPEYMVENGTITGITLTEPTTDLNGAPCVMQDGKPTWGGTIDPKFLPEIDSSLPTITLETTVTLGSSDRVYLNETEAAAFDEAAAAGTPCIISGVIIDGAPSSIVADYSGDNIYAFSMVTAFLQFFKDEDGWIAVSDAFAAVPVPPEAITEDYVLKAKPGGYTDWEKDSGSGDELLLVDVTDYQTDEDTGNLLTAQYEVSSDICNAIVEAIEKKHRISLLQYLDEDKTVPVYIPVSGSGVTDGTAMLTVRGDGGVNQYIYADSTLMTQFAQDRVHGSVYELDAVSLGFDTTNTENQILPVSQELVDEICNAIKANRLVLLSVKMDSVSLTQIPYQQVDVDDAYATIVYSSIDVSAMSINLTEIQVDKRNRTIGIGQTVVPLGGSTATA